MADPVPASTIFGTSISPGPDDPDTNGGPVIRLALKQTSLFAIVLPVILCLPAGLRGQTEVSLQGGMSLATLGGSDIESADSRAGLRVGASAILPLTPSLDLQLGAAYAAKGATEQGFGLEVDLELGYLEMPLLLRFSPSAAGTISPHFMAGPALALRVSCNAAASAEGLEISADCDDEFDDLKSMDLGAMAGAGLDIATSGSLSVSVDVLYNFGLSSISESDDVKNRAFSLLAGVRFPIGQ